MDREHTVNSFEEVGMCNPFKTKKSEKESRQIINTFDFYSEVYPKFIFGAIMEALANNDKVKPPKCVFVPSKKLLRSIIKALIKYWKDDEETILLRFGLI